MNEVSVGIPTMGRVDTLPTVLYSLLVQTHRITELVLLDEAPRTVMLTPAITQVLDLLAMQGVEVKIIRRRPRRGIGAARMLLAQEAKCPMLLMVDDDVIIRPNMLELLDREIERAGESVAWAVPMCFLVCAMTEKDGYVDRPIRRKDPAVLKWTEKYPWFVPYFQYEEDFVEALEVAGTQAILWRREDLLLHGSEVVRLDVLPREDTYLTKVTGPGIFVSKARCDHIVHDSQETRGEWSSSMFYRLHHAIQRDPEGFLKLMER